MFAVYVWEQHGGIGSWNPVGDFHEFNKFCVPICVEITRLDPLGGQGERYTTVIVGAVDHDLRTLEDPGQNWMYDVDKGVGIGTPRYAARTGAWGNRPYAVARMPPTPSLDPRFVVVRTHSTYRIQANFRCVDDPVDDPLPEDILSLVSFWIKVVMFDSPAAALSVSIKDDTGWRLRRAYTLAPRAYEDTYPESQFRIASMSKMLTSFATFATLDAEGYGLDTKVFELKDWPLQPSIGLGPSEYPPELLELTVADLLVHKGGWRNKSFNPGRESKPILTAFAGTDKMSGWQTPSGVGLLPMIRTDMVQYMLDTEVFRNNPPDGNLTMQTGYRPLYAAGQEPPAYSGWHYEMLGVVIEILNDDGVSDPRENWAHYVRSVKSVLLEHVDALRTDGARQSRYFASEQEVVYPTMPYVQQSNVPVEDFKETKMFTPAPSDYDPQDPQAEWYPDDEPRPPDVGRAPPFGSVPYAPSYNREVTVPGGGWVSTAPDVCRVLDALDPGKMVLSQSSISTITDTQNLTESELDNPGWKFTPGGLNFVNSTNVSIAGLAVGTRAEMNYFIPDRGGVVVLSNAQYGHRFNVAAFLARLVQGQ